MAKFMICFALLIAAVLVTADKYGGSVGTQPVHGSGQVGHGQAPRGQNLGQAGHGQQHGVNSAHGSAHGVNSGGASAYNKQPIGHGSAAHGVGGAHGSHGPASGKLQPGSAHGAHVQPGSAHGAARVQPGSGYGTAGHGAAGHGAAGHGTAGHGASGRVQPGSAHGSAHGSTHGAGHGQTGQGSAGRKPGGY